MNSNFIPFDPSANEINVPSGYDIVIREKGDESNMSASVLYGFDEIGLFDDEFSNPEYGFLKL